MDKLATIYIIFNVIYSTLFIIFVCGNEAFMTPWWVTLIAAIVPAVLTLIGSLTLSRRSQLRKTQKKFRSLLVSWALMMKRHFTLNFQNSTINNGQYRQDAK